MIKTCKRIALALSLSALGFFAYKIYKIIQSVLELQKILPQYLENVSGEKPVISIHLSFNKIIIKAFFSSQMQTKKTELESEISSYVENHYPAICMKKLQVVITEKSAEAEAEADEADEATDPEKKKSDEGWSI